MRSDKWPKLIFESRTLVLDDHEHLNYLILLIILKVFIKDWRVYCAIVQPYLVVRNGRTI